MRVSDSSCSRPFLRPQPFLAPYAFMHCHRLELIHDSGSFPPGDAGATPAAADPDSRESAPRCEGNHLSASASEYARHPADRSSALAPAWLGSAPDRRSIFQSSAPPTSARTSASVRWPRFPPVPVFPLTRDRTAQPQRDAPAALLRILLFPCPPKRFVARSGDNRIP